MLARGEVAASLGPGTHGSTFGGNPLSCSAALAVLDVIEEDGLLENVRIRGMQLLAGLEALRTRQADIVDVRGSGLLIGMEMAADVAALVTACRERGLLLLSAGPCVLRFLPPLNVTDAEIDEALAIVSESLKERT